MQMRKSISRSIFVKLQHKRGIAIQVLSITLGFVQCMSDGIKEGQTFNAPDTVSLNHNEIQLICRADVL